MDYITAQDVTDTLGAGWADGGDEARAVRQANAWLSAELNGRAFETVPAPVIEAGAELARMSAEDALFADSEGLVKSESVTADTVSVETTFQDGSRPVQGAMTYVRTLLKPYLMPLGVTMLKRV